MGTSARRVRVQRGRRRLPRRLRSPGRRWGRRLAGLLATALFATMAFSVGRLVMPADGLRGLWSDLHSHPAPARPGGGAPVRPARHGHVTTLRRAVGVLRARGYAPVRRADYRRRAVLRVLVGRPLRHPRGPRRAFFFARGRFAGHDARTPSRRLAVASARRRSVTLAYGVRPGHRVRKVRFRWTGRRVKALDRVPPRGARGPA